jgi:hypothetical protein
MFEGLDTMIDEERISSYGVSITTLDEVFLLVARGETKEKQELASSARLATSITDDAEKSARSRMNLENEWLFATHLGALVKKRAANFKRDKKAWCCTTILPSVLVLIGFVIFKFASPSRDLQPLTLTLDSYNPNIQTTPRNPIPFNAPDQDPYLCQPGICAYQVPVVYIPAPYDEVYFYCGSQASFNLSGAFFGEYTGNENCSISQSSDIVSRITDAGAEGVATSVETINEVG